MWARLTQGGHHTRRDDPLFKLLRVVGPEVQNRLHGPWKIHPAGMFTLSRDSQVEELITSFHRNFVSEARTGTFLLKYIQDLVPSNAATTRPSRASAGSRSVLLRKMSLSVGAA